MRSERLRGVRRLIGRDRRRAVRFCVLCDVSAARLIADKPRRLHGSATERPTTTLLAIELFHQENGVRGRQRPIPVVDVHVHVQRSNQPGT